MLTSKNIFKDYYLRSDGLLFRPHLKQKKHLLWREGGVPCFNASVYYKYRDKIKWLGAKTEKEKFKIPRDRFEKDVIAIDNRSEQQLTVSRFWWDIEPL